MNTAFLLFWIIGSIVAFIGGLIITYSQLGKITLYNIIFWAVTGICGSWAAATIPILLLIFNYLEEKFDDIIIFQRKTKKEEEKYEF